MAEKEVYSKERNMSTKETFLTFLCNKNTGEFCGRTPGSWAKILLFYVIFYACLATFWAVMLLIFYTTISYNEPKWQQKESLIGTNPGLGFRPRAPASNVESTLIWFSSSKPKSYEEQVNDIQKFINDENRPLGTDNTNIADSACSVDEPQKDLDKYCLFDTNQMFVDMPADMNCKFKANESYYGYDRGTPCVIIKLNRIFGWTPENYKSQQIDEMKQKKGGEELFKNLRQGHVFITCEGENPADVENIKKVMVHPKEGISFKYFPFRNKPGYVSPFVFVQFEVKNGVLINVECKAWASNIKHDRMDREGSVHFELLVD
ncbi:sodium/potassium-transporting ATPase subunit beta-like protein [Dinothrombium tinctorium]|uniref:Sodium/potassium-transporting ATPase subunit beta-like protein n=1 Tax=Dinothrombium tinctorium TaxID=1965070 RepID=A0A3S3P7Q1_9ACAR|nr:sodium/potassium-transporting ATPase subunit beta-like protein [Dinothrombium tinctorium]